MRKKIKGMLIGTLIMALICLVCALLEIASAVSYISMIGPGTGAGTADMILYVINEAFDPVGAFFILMAVSCIEYILMHLGRKPEKKEPKPKRAPRERSEKKKGFGKRKREEAAAVPSDYERPQPQPRYVEAPQVRPEAQSEPHVSEERRPAQGTKFPINTKRRVSEESRREGDS